MKNIFSLFLVLGLLTACQNNEKTNNKGNKKMSANDTSDSEFTTTGSGLQYLVMREGTGEMPEASDTVEVHYEGTFSDGKVFDSSYKRGETISFALSQVIKGWTEGLQLMKEGAKYKFIIPADLAYGSYDYNGIPGGSTLTFVVELIKVK
jgi:FKBP-type peptidyl-prolyl cis-trans isomerase